MTPRVVVLSSPSGGGKTTITRLLLAKRSDIGYSVSATTRAPRAGEDDGVAYHFLSQAEFQRRRKAGEFLETAEYAGEHYGTLKSAVDDVLNSGRHVLLDIEIQGARRVRAAYPGPRSLTVFVLPPTARELATRLSDRQSDSHGKIRRRLELAVEEIRESNWFDYVVVNAELDRAVASVAQAIDDDPSLPKRPKNYDAIVEAMQSDLNEALNVF